MVGSIPSPTTRTAGSVIRSLIRWSGSFLTGPLLRSPLLGCGFIGAANEILYPGVALGFYSKNYTSSSNAEKNIFVVGAGSNANNRKNSIEQKYNGDLYVAGLGSFDGTNSSSNNVDSLQEVITKLAARIEALETLHANE